MEEYVLEKYNIVKVYLCFEDGKKVKRKELVELKAVDEKNCYFYGPSLFDIIKPGWFAKAEIIVYTTEGTYTAVEKIREMDFALEKILYIIAKPKKWKFVQLRVGDRKTIKLPIKIEFNNDMMIESEITNLSITGFQINAKENLTNLQMKFPCNCIISFLDGEQELKAKYVRQELILDDYALAGYKAYSFKFLNLFPEQRSMIKNYLQNIR